MATFLFLFIIACLWSITEGRRGRRRDHDYDAYDIVIIGAGLSGLIHSHLLTTLSDNNYKTLTIERFNRVCGRTFSSKLTSNGKSIIFEHGAMRFYYNKLHQKIMHRMGLCMNIIPFFNQFLSQINIGSNFLYKNKLKESITGEDDVYNYFAEIYNLNENEIKWIKNSSLPELYGYQQILHENQDKNRRDFWTKWTLKNILIINWERLSFFKNVLNISTEYFNFINRNGFILQNVNIGQQFLIWAKDNLKEDINDPFPINFNNDFNELTSLDLHQESGIFNINNNGKARQTLYTLDNGYDSICKRLYQNSSSYDCNNFLFQYDVIAVNYNYKKRSRHKYKYKYIVTMRSNVDPDHQIIRKVYTNHVISTIPPQQFKVLLPNINIESINNKYINYLINSVIMAPSYKISLIYDSDWWINRNIMKFSGHITTDMDIQGLLMEKHWSNDTLTVIHIYTLRPQQSDLWNQLQEIGTNDPYINPSSSIILSNQNDVLLSSKLVVNQVVKQLSLLTKTNIPYPLAAYSSPLGYNISMNDGVYFWNKGYNVEDVLNNIIKPIKNENIYIASSSISPYQAWAYGAVWAAIKNLKENFNIKDPLKNQGECLFPNGTIKPLYDNIKYSSKNDIIFEDNLSAESNRELIVSMVHSKWTFYSLITFFFVNQFIILYWIYNKKLKSNKINDKQYL